MASLGPMEIVLILIVVIVLFGSKKLPELGKGIGDGIKEFKKAIKDSSEEKSSNAKKDEKES